MPPTSPLMAADRVNVVMADSIGSAITTPEHTLSMRLNEVEARIEVDLRIAGELTGSVR